MRRRVLFECTKQSQRKTFDAAPVVGGHLNNSKNSARNTPLSLKRSNTVMGVARSDAVSFDEDEQLQDKQLVCNFCRFLVRKANGSIAGDGKQTRLRGQTTTLEEESDANSNNTAGSCRRDSLVDDLWTDFVYLESDEILHLLNCMLDSTFNGECRPLSAPVVSQLSLGLACVRGRHKVASSKQAARDCFVNNVTSLGTDKPERSARDKSFQRQASSDQPQFRRGCLSRQVGVAGRTATRGKGRLCARVNKKQKLIMISNKSVSYTIQGKFCCCRRRRQVSLSFYSFHYIRNNVSYRVM